MYPAVLPPIESSISPDQALLKLFSDPYLNLIPRLFSRTRDYALGLDFVDKCRDTLVVYRNEIPAAEAQFIEYALTFWELDYLDALNRWHEYLELFEKYFLEKRTEKYILRYKRKFGAKETDNDRFGRYLFGYDGYDALVHSFYIIERRRAIIERKQIRLEEGKSVEHLKRHQKEQLPSEELERRFEEIRKLMRRM